MKLTLSLAALIGLVAAAPTALDKRQTGSTANELSGPCRAVTFIFARGSTETGNLGTIIGPPVSNGLKARYGVNNVATQGVNYAALLTTNFIPNGGDPQGIQDMKNQLTTAANKCPNTKIVAGGYSQGAAITHQAIETLSAAVRNRIVAAVTFGDTQNLQDRGRIPNYPPANTRIFCAAGDPVCAGTLIINAAHLSYGIDAGPAVSFLTSKIGNI
ncbi:Cutinase-like protein 9 [Elsinoe fawcettii]|nr:Cutinase-like protein 9 [Elsinoe fawcettii]